MSRESATAPVADQPLGLRSGSRIRVMVTAVGGVAAAVPVANTPPARQQITTGSAVRRWSWPLVHGLFDRHRRDAAQRHLADRATRPTAAAAAHQAAQHARILRVQPADQLGEFAWLVAAATMTGRLLAGVLAHPLVDHLAELLALLGGHLLKR